jgi:hypothetical protein
MRSLDVVDRKMSLVKDLELDLLRSGANAAIRIDCV